MGLETVLLFEYFAKLLFFVLLLAFTIHTVFLAYHWFTFGTSRKAAMTALTVYLTGSSLLFIIMAISMYAM